MFTLKTWDTPWEWSRNVTMALRQNHSCVIPRTEITSIVKKKKKRQRVIQLPLCYHDGAINYPGKQRLENPIGNSTFETNKKLVLIPRASRFRSLNLPRFALALSRARISIRARTQAKGLSLSLSLSRGSKSSFAISQGRACNENHCLRDGGNQSSWSGGWRRILASRYAGTIYVFLATQIDSIARRPIGLDSYADLAWDIWFHALRDILFVPEV